MMMNTNMDKEKASVTKVIHDAIGWALTKDFNLLFSIMAQDDDFFIFHPDSKSNIQGFDAFKKLADGAWASDLFRATDFAIRELKLKFSHSGSVVWYSCYLDDHAEWNGKPIGWDNARWTGVVEKRDERWVIVQMHFSFAKDD